jgi:hypothetical protein
MVDRPALNIHSFNAMQHMRDRKQDLTHVGNSTDGTCCRNHSRLFSSLNMSYIKSRSMLSHYHQPSPFSPLTSQQAPTIQSNSRTTIKSQSISTTNLPSNYSLHKSTTPPTQKQTRPGHILRRSNPTQRNPTFNRISKILQRLLHHLTLERSTSNHIAGDVALTQVCTEHSR